MSRAADAATVATSLTPPSTIARLIGLGSVFGKGLRDSRRATIAVGLFCGLFVMATAGAIASDFKTADSRIALVGSIAAIPLIQGLLGPPINVGTLGGVISWRAVSTLPLLVGIWSIIALSGTLAAEGRRGTLEFLATVPLSRRRLAAQKALAHVVALAGAMAIFAVLTWLATRVFATLPEDPVPASAAISTAIGVGLGALFGGAVAFAVAPFLGRSAAAGVGAVVLFASYIVNGFASTIVGLDLLRPLSYFSWVADHRPLAGSADWPPVIALGAGASSPLAIGVEVFARRDIGTTAIGRFVPRLHYGTGGPAGRSFADRVPISTGLGGRRGAVRAARVDVGLDVLGPARHRPGAPAAAPHVLSDRRHLDLGGGPAADSTSPSPCSCSDWPPRRPSAAGPRTRATAGSRWSCPRRCRDSGGVSPAGSG